MGTSLDAPDLQSKTASLVAMILALPGIRSDAGATLEQMLREYKYRAELLKELIFESVRMKNYISKPSRQRCMFLFHESLDYCEYATALGFSPSRYTLLRVESCGDDDRVLVAKLPLLNCNTQPYAEIEARAVEYWSGAAGEAPSVEHEILFEGSLRIVEIIQRSVPNQ